MTTIKNFYKRQISVAGELLSKKKRAKQIFGVERLFLTSIALLLLISPSFTLKGVADLWGYKARKIAVDVYVILKPTVLFLILLLGLATSLFGFLATVLLLIDLHLFLLGLFFLRRRFWEPVASLERSILFLLINFLEIVFGFAIIHIYTGAIVNNGKILSTWVDAIYFSVVTATTLGYGDYHPINFTGKVAVILQLISALVVLTVFLAAFVGNASKGIVERTKKKN